jgi:hypothetical protein
VVGFQFTVTREEESTDMVVMLGVRGAVVSVIAITVALIEPLAVARTNIAKNPAIRRNSKT